MTLRGVPRDLLLAAAGLPENKSAASLLRRAANEGVGKGAPKRRRPAEAKQERREGLSSLRLTLYGAPRTKKNSAARLSHKGRPSIVPSEAWMKWRTECLCQVLTHRWMRLRDGRYNVSADFYRDADRGDAVSYYQGLADVLQECGVIRDDKFLVSWEGSRLLVDREHPRVEITLTLAQVEK